MTEAPDPMDTDQILAAAHAALGAAGNMLNLVAIDQAGAQGELEEIATDLAQALESVLSWMPEAPEDNNQLLGALARWL